MIRDLIQSRADTYLLHTGRKPIFLYLGRNQCEELLQSAIDNGYLVPGTTTFSLIGTRRPEVCGMKVYMVNTSDHMACC